MAEIKKTVEVSVNIILMMVLLYFLWQFADKVENNQQCDAPKNLLFQEHCLEEVDDPNKIFQIILDRLNFHQEISPTSKAKITEVLELAAQAITQDKLRIVDWTASKTDVTPIISFGDCTAIEKRLGLHCEHTVIIDMDDLKKPGDYYSSLVHELTHHQQLVKKQETGEANEFIVCPSGGKCELELEIMPEFLSNLVQYAFRDLEDKNTWTNEDTQIGINLPNVAILLDKKGLSPDKSALFAIFEYMSLYNLSAEQYRLTEEILAKGQATMNEEDLQLYRQDLPNIARYMQLLVELMEENYATLTPEEQELYKQIVNDPNLVINRIILDNEISGTESNQPMATSLTPESPSHLISLETNNQAIN